VVDWVEEGNFLEEVPAILAFCGMRKISEGSAPAADKRQKSETTG
jgi:hypothetical protein